MEDRLKLTIPSALTNNHGPRDHIVDFAKGDRIDLSRVTSDNEDFAGLRLFFSGAASATRNEIGSLSFDHEFLDEDFEITVVFGNLDDDDDVEFEVSLDRHHDLTEQDFILAARVLDG